MDDQPPWLGVAGTPKFKENARFIHKEREELDISDKTFFNHHALYVGSDETNACYSTIKVANRGVTSILSLRECQEILPYRCGFCPAKNSATTAVVINMIQHYVYVRCKTSC